MTTSKKTSTMINVLWGCLALFCASVQVTAQRVEIEPAGRTAVRVGQNLTIVCRLAVPLDNCRVEIPGGESLFLRPGQPARNGIEYHGSSLEAGQCGAHIARVTKENDGKFKCSLTPRGSPIETSATTDIVVAQAPSNPELSISEGNRGRLIFEKGQSITISCRAKAGRPAANVSLFLDNEPIGTDERQTIWDSSTDNNSLAIKNVTRVLEVSDNGKTLRCVAEHIALDRPLTTTQQLQVEFPPQNQGTIQRFGYVIGRPGTVNVTVEANPRPNFIWHIDDEQIEEGQPDESNRIETNTAVELGRGLWELSLRIDSVQKSDTEKKYMLEARNDLGSNNYLIALSTSTEPPEGISNRTTSPHAHAGAFSHFYGKAYELMHALGAELDAGSIIGIVVGILILLLIVFLIVFARATGRWCFAGGSSSRTLGESDIADPAASVSLLRFRKPKPDVPNAGRRSDTESAGRYSRSEVDAPSRRRRPKMTFSQLFKRNKDKVSGADTDTVRTVVTVDDEKIQTSEVPSSVTLNTANPAVGEGGLVYAELDLTQRKNIAPRRIDDDTTEYAEIIYTKPEAEEAAAAAAANNAKK